MVRISYDDFKKLDKLLDKEGCGAHLTFRDNGTVLEIRTMDRAGKEIVIELSDVDYPMLPRVTRTEIF